MEAGPAVREIWRITCFFTDSFAKSLYFEAVTTLAQQVSEVKLRDRERRFVTDHGFTRFMAPT